MPVYDFACNTCKRRFSLRFGTYNAYFAATPACTHCGSTDVTRTIGRVGISKSESTRFGDMADDSAMQDLENADPATLGRYLRRMGEEAGEPLGEEFSEVVDRLERGEDPEAIEQALPQLADPEGVGAEFDSESGSSDTGSFDGGSSDD